ARVRRTRFRRGRRRPRRLLRARRHCPASDRAHRNGSRAIEPINREDLMTINTRDTNTAWSLTADGIADLYRAYADDLRRGRDAQRELLRQRGKTMRTQLDDLEAELTYLRLRAHRPETVIEIGALHGWSTTWILSALRDNATGHLYSYDLIDDAVRQVPQPLAA